MARASSDLEHPSQPENRAGKTRRLHGLAVPPSLCPLLALSVLPGEAAVPALLRLWEPPSGCPGAGPPEHSPLHHLLLPFHPLRT